MFAWWNSLESMSKFNNRIQLVIIGLGLLTALAMYLGHKASQQIDFLQSNEKSLMQKRLDNLSPRHLQDNDKELLNLEFNKLKGTEIIIQHPDNAETSVFAEEIKRSMLSSGIITKRIVILAGPLPHGISISASFSESTQNILSNAFNSIGIVTHVDDSMASHTIYIGIKKI